MAITKSMKNKEELAEEYANSKKWMDGGPENWVKNNFIAGFESAQQWIQVEKIEDIPINHMLVCTDLDDINVFWFGSSDEARLCIERYEITHWLPIPKLPTE